MKLLRIAVPCAMAILVAVPAATAQQNDEAYTAKILEYTTEPFFLTPYVDHLPASETVPTPFDVLGHIVGAPDVLSYPAEIYRYMRALAEASPRVEVFTMGQTEEGREMILVVVSDETTIARLDEYKDMLGRLGDPRMTSEAEAVRLIGTAKPIYWATGAIHSPETGSPEMLMELAYR
ncbi:MAG: M14 family zinc carboxypeptidase, partial [Gemmatimonadetes bacterium]|nr:M14 family zinc carboxypeptidase [Gemmatimonadota bacterium]